MPKFRLALTGDFLNSSGQSAYGDIGLARLDAAADFLEYRIIKEHAPRADDPDYWSRFYKLTVTADQIRDLDGLVVLRPGVHAATFAHGPGDLTVIGRSGAGYDKIDVPVLTANHVALFNAPLALNHSTASSALLFMLALAKRLPAQDRVTREGRWERQAEVMGEEIAKRTLGIIGLGHSGKELARLVAPFEMRILAYSPRASAEDAAQRGIRLCSLDELLRESDFVSVHARLSDETRGMLGAREFSLMKSSAYFINIARGAIVDQAALTAVLTERRITGAGLDVFTVEPLPADDPLTRLENVILAPHWSCSTSDVWRATGQAMTEGMLRASRGELPENIVNPEVLQSAVFQAKLRRFAR